MSKALKNWSYLLFSDLSQAAINFVVFILLANKLSPEAFGEFNIVLSFFMLFTMFSNNFGSNHVITREIALRPNLAYPLLPNLLKLRLVGFILTTISLIFYSFFNKDLDSVTIFYVSVLLLANSIWDLSESIAFGMFITKLTTIINIIFSVIWLLIINFYPEISISLSIVLIIYSSLFIIKSIIYLITILKYSKSRNELEKSDKIGYKSLILMSFPYLWMRVLGAFSDQLPILALGQKSGAIQVAYFSVGLKLVLPITLTVSTGLRAMFPFITNLYHTDREKFRIKILDAFGLVFILGTVIATIFVNISEFALPFLFGVKYNSSIESFNLLVWFAVGLCFDLLLSTILSSTYKQNLLSVLTTIDLIIMLPVLYIGAQYGAFGLSVAKLVSLIVILTYHIIVVNYKLKINLFNRDFILSLLFFLTLMLTNIFIDNIYIRTACILAIFIFFTFYKYSPILRVFRLIASKLSTLKLGNETL